MAIIHRIAEVTPLRDFMAMNGLIIRVGTAILFYRRIALLIGPMYYRRRANGRVAHTAMKQRRTAIQLSPSERQAVAQARQALALAVPQIRDTNLKRSLHSALCMAERSLKKTEEETK
jgi:hypothetical protein